MFSAIARTFRSRPPQVDADQLVFAVGDVHGCDELLEALIDGLAEDAAAAKAQTPHMQALLVFLGDYIDRGPDSARVLDLLLDLDGPFDEVRYLRGNHEEAMLGFIEDSSAGSRWCAFGGDATLKSYGVNAPAANASAAEWEGARAQLANALPKRHEVFLRQLETITTIGDYAFVHAGVRPGVMLAEQSERDMLWIRDEFLDDDSRLEKIIVHGHTPEPEPVHNFRRIGVDTGAYASGVLTAARLCGESVSFLQSSTR